MSLDPFSYLSSTVYDLRGSEDEEEPFLRGICDLHRLVLVSLRTGFCGINSNHVLAFSFSRSTEHAALCVLAGLLSVAVVCSPVASQRRATLSTIFTADLFSAPLPQGSVFSWLPQELLAGNHSGQGQRRQQQRSSPLRAQLLVLHGRRRANMTIFGLMRCVRVVLSEIHTTASKD